MPYELINNNFSRKDYKFNPINICKAISYKFISNCLYFILVYISKRNINLMYSRKCFKAKIIHGFVLEILRYAMIHLSIISKYL